jgi:hypothetical protein
MGHHSTNIQQLLIVFCLLIVDIYVLAVCHDSSWLQMSILVDSHTMVCMRCFAASAALHMSMHFVRSMVFPHFSIRCLNLGHVLTTNMVSDLDPLVITWKWSRLISHWYADR